MTEVDEGGHTAWRQSGGEIMTMLKYMSGEELLLVRVLGGAKVQPAIDQELDRRALLGAPRRPRRIDRWATPDPRCAA